MDDVQNISATLYGKAEPATAKTTMSVREMQHLLGLGKTDSYWLLHKNFFEVILINDKMRIVISSFEKWYANQVKYHKVNGPPPGEELCKRSYSILEVAEILKVDSDTVYTLIRQGKLKAETVDFWMRIPKKEFERWYRSQSRHRTAADRERDREIEAQTISIPEMAKLLGIPREKVYWILDCKKYRDCFVIVRVADRRRITKTSFEIWLNSQSTYRLQEPVMEAHEEPPLELKSGNVLPEFEKVLDIDIKAAAEAVLGKELTQNLLSVVFDYDGNLWFATGGFRIYPQRQQQGVIGYIAHSAIDAILNGKQTDLSKAVFVHELTPGEGAENGIAASKEGAVILTNQNCYLLRAEDGVNVVLCTPYKSAGAKVSGEGDKTTGGGLAWGGGGSPTLTPNLVLFTDNQDPVNLLALDMKTGEVVASTPVLDDLPEGYQVAVENSAIVYDDGEGTVSTIVCNWFGAGNAGLADPNNDSSIQSYANIYDQNWLMKGNIMIAPGIERVDTVKTANGYEMKSVWCRNDLSDTSIFKLSTATGYLYGYVQDVTTGMWQYIVLDFETGETVFTMDVSNKYGYNNMAIGMYAGNSGNALYCPTGYLELLRLQDRFVYLPEMPYRKVDLDKAARNVLTQAQFEQDGGEGTVASWRNTATVENVHPNTTVAFRMNDLSGSTSALTLYAYGADGKLTEVSKELWTITDEAGAGVDTLADGTLYELRVSVADGGAFDLSEAEKEIKISVVLAK